eukprot:TRINITY_DN5954_c0_g2_i1.p1 TRINITY_DN5954_c0_g2~~TRINITY_DN5954_c0_g2_i1.p1  ORF type:complete len:235 (+),score=41.49 TRINITY_DN5954_c0_g2_i1:137-841(+)
MEEITTTPQEVSVTKTKHSKKAKKNPTNQATIGESPNNVPPVPGKSKKAKARAKKRAESQESKDSSLIPKKQSLPPQKQSLPPSKKQKVPSGKKEVGDEEEVEEVFEKSELTAEEMVDGEMEVEEEEEEEEKEKVILPHSTQQHSIFVSDLPGTTTASDLQKVFSSAFNVRLVPNSEPRCAFVDFRTPEDQHAALRSHSKISGQTISIQRLGASHQPNRYAPYRNTGGLIKPHD